MRNRLWLWVLPAALCAFRFGSADFAHETAQKAREKAEARAAAGVVPKGGRLLSIDVTAAQDNDYVGAFALAKNAGMQVVPLTILWKDVETSPGVFNPNPNNLAIANAFYPPENVQVSLVIGVIDTNVLVVPPDLAGVAFDDPQFIARFKGLLDYVFTQIPNVQLAAFSIGNEVDIYLGSNAAQWDAYRHFFEAVAPYARAKRASLRVGVKQTWMGMTAPATRAFCQALNQTTDLVMANHYLIDGSFQVKPVAALAPDWEALLALYPGRTVHFTEAGSPSSATNGATETHQSDFIREVFRIWDRHAGQLELVNFVRSTDVSQTQVDTWAAYYGISDPAFKEYLRTLGLRNHPGAGSDKTAFQTLKTEAQSRGW